jgi:ATP-binding cassette subfamily F protein 3
MVSRGGVAPFDGDLDDYQRYLLDEAKRQRELAKAETKAQAPQPAATTAKPAPAPANGKSTAPVDAARKWKKELDQVEQHMQTLQAEGAALEGKLSTNPHPSEIAEAGKRIKTVNDELKKLEDRWLELTTLLEA